MPFHIGNQVIPLGLSPYMTPMFILALSVALENGWTVWWTSCSDRTHGGKSKHYRGDGVDFAFFDADGNDVSYQAGQIMVDRNKCVDYDIVPKRDHTHTEYDPERPGRPARRYRDELIIT